MSGNGTSDTYSASFAVCLRDETLSNIAGLTGGPGQPSTVEAFIAAAIAYAVSVNRETYRPEDILVGRVDP